MPTERRSFRGVARVPLLATLLVSAAPLHAVDLDYVQLGVIQEYELAATKKSSTCGPSYCTQDFVYTDGTFVIVGQPPHPTCPTSKFRYTPSEGGGPAEIAPPALPLDVVPIPLDAAGDGGSGGGGGGGVAVANDPISQAIVSASKNQHVLQTTYARWHSQSCENGVGYWYVKQVMETDEDARTVDLNTNGLRDDVEAYLNRTYATNASLRALAEKEARAIIGMDADAFSGFANCHADAIGYELATKEIDTLTGIIVYNRALMADWLTALDQGPGRAKCTP